MKEIATDLLYIVWLGIDNEYKSRYRRTIWEQYENRVRSSSDTNSLGKFINSLCLKINATIPVNMTKRAEEILNSGNDKELLKLYREETTLIVLMVRVRNDDHRAVWDKGENKGEDKKSQDEYLEEWDTTFAELNQSNEGVK